MEPAVDCAYEMTMKRNPALEEFRGISCNFPEAELWRTKDLFLPHPTKPKLWKFHARTDDIIVLSNGDKYNPVPSETQIAAHPLLAGALITGQGYPQPSLLLEPKDHSRDLTSLVGEVWPTVEQANADVPRQGRITRGMILVTTSSKPFERAAKGTVIRSTTAKKYEQEIAQLYADETSRNFQHIVLGPSPSFATTVKFVNEVVACVFPAYSSRKDDDLFVMGLDSLQTTEMVSLLKAGIQAGREGLTASWLSPRFVYEHSSVDNMAQAIQHKQMETMVDKCIYDLPKRSKEPSQDLQLPNQHTVMLTGSTGSLGTQILVKLLSDSSVTRVHCLDRSADAHKRISATLASWPVAPTLDTARVSFHQADLGKPGFGLTPTVLSTLRETPTCIIHNAWQVDFNLSLKSFEAVHIRGVRHIIDVSIESTYHPCIAFVSSLSSVGNSRRVSEERQYNLLPENSPLAINLGAAQPLGYGESKAVAERILAHAAQTSGVRTAIMRVGQVAGPIGEGNGARWDETEWLPLLLKTSKATGRLPLLLNRDDGSLLASVDWVPSDVLASAVGDIATNFAGNICSDLSACEVVHLVNPEVRPWEDLLPVMKSRLGVSQVVSLSDWVAELEQVDVNDKDALRSRPAVKILDFFRDMGQGGGGGGGGDEAAFSTERASRMSETLRRLGPVRDEWMEKWMMDLGI
ncbi:Uu.00g032190.m01.CDS01 [Anthostomella pinea]|uniref:Uu.00g032190.m01.CDS01 n=1 Tax=Anthostomella pinea TaxID=933095 RepID=A0AAI8V9N3_9PEZI|nr:Uu.00g032190.m01.CDS01 [Anthostomella pinea]